MKLNNSPRAPIMPTDTFRLMILHRDRGDLNLGYRYDDAFPKLKAAGPEDTLFIIEPAQIEAYHWSAQSIALTTEGTQGLLLALQERPEVKEAVRARTEMMNALGWGNRLELALYAKGFLVALGAEPLYGGIFLDSTSQLAIRYPVIRVFLPATGKAVLNLLPIHIPFFARDPITIASGARDTLVSREAIGDWNQFPEAIKAGVASQANSELAWEFRRSIKSKAVWVIMENEGKLR
jgi:hypothetical protein